MLQVPVVAMNALHKCSLLQQVSHLCGESLRLLAMTVSPSKMAELINMPLELCEDQAMQVTSNACCN